MEAAEAVVRKCKKCGTKLTDLNKDQYCYPHQSTPRSVFVLKTSTGHIQLCLSEEDAAGAKGSHEGFGDTVEVLEVTIEAGKFFRLKEAFEKLLELDDELMMVLVFTVPEIMLDALQKK